MLNISPCSLSFFLCQCHLLALIFVYVHPKVSLKSIYLTLNCVCMNGNTSRLYTFNGYFWLTRTFFHHFSFMCVARVTQNHYLSINACAAQLNTIWIRILSLMLLMNLILKSQVVSFQWLTWLSLSSFHSSVHSKSVRTFRHFHSKWRTHACQTRWKWIIFDLWKFCWKKSKSKHKISKNMHAISIKNANHWILLLLPTTQPTQKENEKKKSQDAIIQLC